MNNPVRAHGFGVRQLVGGERIEGTFGEVRGQRFIKRQRKSRGGRKKIKTKTKRGQRNLWRGEWEQILRKRKDIGNLWSGKN